MGLEKEVNKRKAREVSIMARVVCDELGSSRTEVDEIGQSYTEYSSYTTRTFDISNDSCNCGPEIKYKGQLVFRATRKTNYRRHGDWEKQFERVYSRAVNEQKRLMREWHIPAWIQPSILQ